MHRHHLGCRLILLGSVATAWCGAVRADERSVDEPKFVPLTATGTASIADVWHERMGTRGGVINDNCADAPVDTLNAGDTLTYDGDNTGATTTCDALDRVGDTWHAFDLTETATVTTDKCGTVPVWGNAFIVIDTDCPCSGVFIFADAFDQAACADGNWSVHYNNLPAGDYWAPEILDPDNGNEGKYIFSISAN